VTQAPPLASAPRYRLRLRVRPLEHPAAAGRLPWYVIFLLCYLAAITIIGKGPTYIGVPPLYWGEAVMATSLLFIAPWVKRTNFLNRQRPLTILILFFLGIGAVWTVLSFPRWRLDALRDSALCYYALFYFVGLGLASREGVANRVWFWLRIFWICSLFWNTADILSKEALSRSGPLIPGRGVHLFFNSTHEGGQNLALGAWIVLCTTTLIGRTWLRITLGAFAFLGLAAFMASEGRGMRIGIASGVFVVMLLSLCPVGMPNFNTRLIKVAIFGVPLAAMILIAFPERAVKVANLDRFAQAERAEGTAGWRLVWWQNIYDTVLSTNPAFGLGFGESLHVYQPLLASQDDEFMVRSPHNINVTIFARMGIVGLLMWAAILAVGIGTLFRRIWRGSIDGRAYTAKRRDELAFWVLMLVATVVNSSFGVLMEGPVLGIWFWFALGFASGRSLTCGYQPAQRRLQ
jgi:O-antigen ligase